MLIVAISYILIFNQFVYISWCWSCAEAAAGEPAAEPPVEATQEAFISEIKRLRERLVTLESENATLSMKLSQQQWEVEHRLAEIEMQICGASSADSSAEDNERNKESII